MKITALSVQATNKDRVNVSVDGVYRFSLDIFQIGELGVKVGREYSEEEIKLFDAESQFGKLYSRALEYVLMRPRSSKEVKDYLYRKTLSTKTKTGAVKEGMATTLTNRVFERLVNKGYIDDEKFARFWIENRNMDKGISQRKLQSELRAKGVEPSIVSTVLADSPRDEANELQKIVAKKRHRYDDEQKFMQYLLRQGFDYDTIKQVLREDE